MACTHLQKLYQLCQEQELFFSGSDLVRVICKECGAVDVCPTSLTMELPEDSDTLERLSRPCRGATRI